MVEKMLCDSFRHVGPAPPPELFRVRRLDEWRELDDERRTAEVRKNRAWLVDTLHYPLTVREMA